MVVKWNNWDTIVAELLNEESIFDSCILNHLCTLCTTKRIILNLKIVDYVFEVFKWDDTGRMLLS